MPEHKRYRSFHNNQCSCETREMKPLKRFRWAHVRSVFGGSSGTIIPQEWLKHTSVDLGAGNAKVLCKVCGELLADYRRDLELEKQSNSADKDLVGTWIKADRVVAWVGYATEVDTIVLSNEEIEREMAEILWRGLERWFTPRDDLDPLQAARNALGEDIYRYRMERRKALSDLRRDFRREAVYALRGQEMKYSQRGLWFQDRPSIGEVMTIARCWTGRRDPGGRSYGYYGDDWDPPYLSWAVHHTLYGCKDIHGSRFLVYPPDASLSSEKEGVR